MRYNTNKLGRVIALLFLYLLSACSSNRVPTPEKRYWNSPSERPYSIRNKKYYPQVHYQYSAIGEASWYGPNFHGRSTAIGDKFDQNKLTAAHRTLPLPSVVIVENLENGKRAKLLVNDRGPFVRTHRRIIDVSRRAAEVLGFRKKGIAKVRVTCLPAESQLITCKRKRKPYPSRLGIVQRTNSKKQITSRKYKIRRKRR